MVCWDMVHGRLQRELRGNVDLLLVSAAWPDLTTGNIPLPLVQRWMTGAALATPARLAVKLGVPTMFSNLTGDFRTPVPGLGLTYRSRFVGNTSIYDADGLLLKRIGHREGVLVHYLEAATLGTPCTGDESSRQAA